jgi:hypothetical protein
MVVNRPDALLRNAGLRTCYVAEMEVAEAVQCPFCGQVFDLTVDTSVPSQRFVTDCEVCCRPFEVHAECEPGEILSLEVRAG